MKQEKNFRLCYNPVLIRMEFYLGDFPEKMNGLISSLNIHGKIEKRKKRNLNIVCIWKEWGHGDTRFEMKMFRFSKQLTYSKLPRRTEKFTFQSIPQKGTQPFPLICISSINFIPLPSKIIDLNWMGKPFNVF